MATDGDGIEEWPAPPEEKLVYSVAETAFQLGVGKTTVHDLIRTRSLPSLKIGHRRLVARADLEAFVDELRAGAA